LFWTSWSGSSFLALEAVKAVGHYGEMFERNIGSHSRLGVPRGLNQLWSQGAFFTRHRCAEASFRRAQETAALKFPLKRRSKNR
jgi:hypothetical protein